MYKEKDEKVFSCVAVQCSLPRLAREQRGAQDSFFSVESSI